MTRTALGLVVVVIVIGAGAAALSLGLSADARAAPPAPSAEAGASATTSAASPRGGPSVSTAALGCRITAVVGAPARRRHRRVGRAGCAGFVGWRGFAGSDRAIGAPPRRRAWQAFAPPAALAAPTSAAGFDPRHTVVPILFPLRSSAAYRVRAPLAHPTTRCRLHVQPDPGRRADGTLLRAHDGVDLLVPIGRRWLPRSPARS